MLRLFKAFDAQPRLALVTRILESAAVDIAHFGIVFFTIFGTYAVMGTAVFGRDITEFSTLLRAFDYCFAIMMGEFDMNDLRRTGRIISGLSFWSYQMLMIVVMMNMLLALVMDTYSETKGRNTTSDTLFFQAYDM